MKKFCIAIICLLIFSCKTDTKIASPLLKFNPPKAIVVVKINNLSSFKSDIKNNDFLKTIAPTPFFAEFETYFESLQHINTQNEALLCINEVGKDDFEYTLITKNETNLFVIDSTKNASTKTITYNNNQIKEVTIANKTNFNMVLDSTFIHASSKLITENISRNYKNSDYIFSKQFQKLYTVANSEKAATIFINTKLVKSLQEKILPNLHFKLQHFSDWISLDVDLTQDQLALNGIALTDADRTKINTLFKNTIPQQNKMAEIVPANASGFLSFTYNDFTILKNNLANYHAKKASKKETDSLFSLIDEVGLVFRDNNTAVVAHTFAIETATEILNRNAKETSTFREAIIYKYDITDVFTATFSPLIKDSAAHFYTTIDNFIVFAEDIETLKNFITNHQNKATLFHQTNYQELMMTLSDESSFLAVGMHPNFQKVLAKKVSDDYAKVLEKIDFKKYPYFVLQGISDGNFTHINAVIRKINLTAKTNTVSQQFSVTLSADVATAPQWVTNHKTKQKEIVVQDVENNLYLISNTGNILWKKKLKSTIQGKIHQVDLYKNGRLQLAFTTENRFLILDRNGKEVAPFTMNFNKKLNPLAVFDYERTRNYRFLVTSGKQIFMYDRKGKKVNGFLFTKTQSNILFAPKHMVIGNKDYLLFAEANGKFNILNRKGQNRVSINQKIDFSDNDIFLYQHKFTTTDVNGNRIQIDQNGNISKKDLKLTENHFFTATNKTQVTLSDNILKIKNNEIQLDFGRYTKPHIFYIRDKIYVSTTDLETQKVYVFDSNAKMLANFPVYGTSSINLIHADGDKALKFVVQGEKNSILVYQKPL